MPTAPAVIGNLAEAAIGRSAQVLAVGEPAPGFIELGLRAGPPPGGWQPGHEVQFRVTPTRGRRYTVCTVGDASPERISLLAATDANGPGTAWISRLRAGDAVTVLAGRHRPLRGTGPRRLYLGDSCTLATIDACARDRDDTTAVIEARPEAVASLAARWPRYLFLPATPTPGEATLTWLAHAGNDALRDLDGAVLLGHAQSIQRQRRALIDRAGLPRPAIAVRAYWADGKKGL
jgi:NADPH-dependent ferric siderophore reductase